MEYTAIIKHVDKWWIGWVEEIPGINCQERTQKKLIETLQITLREAIELNRGDALAAAGVGFQETMIAV